ncbi:hypothetical protein LINPERHAP2_LOCUS37386 [Linum perenne]
MSWLTTSLSNSLRLDDDNPRDLIDGEVQRFENDAESVPSHDGSPAKRNVEATETANRIVHEGRETDQQQQQQEEEDALSRGVKEDLTELGQTLNRQFWDVATFLAPPPTTTSCDRSDSNLNDCEPSNRSESELSEEASGLGQEFAEIGGRFKSGVTEISKLMGSGYFQFGSEDNVLASEGREQEEGDEEGDDYYEEEFDDDWAAQVVGITDEVLAFASNIAMHPETWLDFPLDEEEDLDDFQMSDAQQLHTSVIEELAPRLAALRIELCPCHMSQSYFWKVYFVLLHSRLNKRDAEVLSTYQVMEARSMWMQELHRQTEPISDWFGRSSSYARQSSDVTNEAFYTPRAAFEVQTTSFESESETEKHLILSTELPFVDKSVIDEKPVVKNEHKVMLSGTSSKITIPSYEYEEEDVWPDAEGSEYGDCKSPIILGDEEDISFSDLEDECIDLPLKKQITK